MTAPVVRAVALAKPNLRIIMVSRPFAEPFFQDMPGNVEFVGINLKDSRYKGVFAMERLYRDLRRLQPDMVADLHDVLRTKYARLRFRMAGIPVCYINKHRKARKALIQREDKVLVQLPTSFENYAEVFRQLGIEVSIGKASVQPASTAGKRMIGIAPFAAHEGKIYPLEKMEQVIKDLTLTYPDMEVILFGGGRKEVSVFEQWKAKYPRVRYAGETCKGFAQEMQLMKQLRCMVSMDSGNMHVASLVGIPVVSIWGATHPFAGFMGWGQKYEDAIQVDLPCRPCSIYGNKPCLRDDYACMNQISPQMIIRKIEEYL